MKSAYVSNASLSVSAANKTTAVKILDMNAASRCRIFQVRYMPADFTASAGVEGWSGDPASGVKVYELFNGDAKYTGYDDLSLMRFWDISPHGILADDDIYVRGKSGGVNFVSITYQLG